jgi:hypothetical protein
MALNHGKACVPTCLVVVVTPQDMRGCIIRAANDNASSAYESEAVALVVTCMDKPIGGGLLFPNIDIPIGGPTHIKHLLQLLLVAEDAEWQRVRPLTKEQRSKV